MFVVKLTIGVSVCVPLFSSKNSKSSGFSVPNVVPLIPVIIRSAVPFVVNRTVQLPPTVGVEYTFIISISASISNSCSDSCGTIHVILSTMPLPFVSTNVTSNCTSFVTSTFVLLIIQCNLKPTLCFTRDSGMSLYDFTFV